MQAEAKCTSREGMAGVSRGGFYGGIGGSGVYLLSHFNVVAFGGVYKDLMGCMSTYMVKREVEGE